MKYCLEVWGTDYARIRDTCILAEKLGYDGFYYGESLTDIDLDCWTVLSGLAENTDAIHLGPVITYVLPQYRSIALLAKQAATLQQISADRLEFRTGAGAIPRYASAWWQPYGIDYPDNLQRAAILEGLQVIQDLWTKSAVYFRGKYFKVDCAGLQRSYRIPVTVAAKGPRMLEIAAKHADVWEASYLSPEQFRDLNSVFSKMTDRDIVRSLELDVVIADSDSELQQKENQFARERGLAYDADRGLVGKPDAIAEKVKAYEKAGVQQMLLAFLDPLDKRALELFIEAVR